MADTMITTDGRKAEETVTEAKVHEWLDAFGMTKQLDKSEVDLFVGVCREMQLNPFKREIHVAAFGTGDRRSLSIITGYEVYLKRAERLNRLDGWKVWIEGEGEATVAKCVIHRKDWSHPFEWEVYGKEAIQRKNDGTVTKFWSKQPKFMLKKVCVAQAMRLCFPDEIGGMPYIREEMPEYDGEPRDITPSQTEATRVSAMVEPQRRALLDRLHQLVNDGTATRDQAKDWESEINKAARSDTTEALALLAGISKRLEQWIHDTVALDEAASQAFDKEESDGPDLF